jgi:hypothetical protein
MIDFRKVIGTEKRMANEKYYRDFRAHLTALEERGKLLRIKREINKDTELMPLVRWQFRGLEERDRKAFIFENVIDPKGRRFAMPVTLGTLAATTEIYAIGMMCEPDAIHERWTQAQLNPIEPVTVRLAPVHEIIWQGADLLNGQGLDMIPVPISTPGSTMRHILPPPTGSPKIPKPAYTTLAIIEARSNRQIAPAACSRRSIWGNTGARPRQKASDLKRVSPSASHRISLIPPRRRFPTILTNIGSLAGWRENPSKSCKPRPSTC